MMAIKMNFNCGCGFKTTSQSMAEEHAVKTGHSLSIIWEIRVTKEKGENDEKVI